MNVLFLIIVFQATYCLAYPHPHPRAQRPPFYIPNLARPTRTSNVPARSNLEHVQSMLSHRLYNAQDNVERRNREYERLHNTYQVIRQEIRDHIEGLRERYEEYRRAARARHDLVLVEMQGEPQAEVVVPEEVEEMDWEGNFTRPEGPRPQPDSAPF